MLLNQHMPAYGVLFLWAKGFTTSIAASLILLIICRWSMPVDEKVYTNTSKKAHTLQQTKELSAHSYSSCAHHMGCVMLLYTAVSCWTFSV